MHHSPGRHPPKAFTQHIIDRSRSTTFEGAIQEWRPYGFFYAHGRCPCGQHIIQHCIIENIHTHIHTEVGNVCVQRFMAIDLGQTFHGLQSIMQDITKHPNKDLIQSCERARYINGKEAEFLYDIQRKRILSPKQVEWLRKINTKIIEATTRKDPEGPDKTPDSPISPPHDAAPSTNIHGTIPLDRAGIRRWLRDGRISEREAMFLFQNHERPNRSAKQQQWMEKILARLSA